LLYLGRVDSRGRYSSSAPSRLGEERPKIPNYDPDFYGKLVKGAACICFGLIVAELLVLLLVRPSDDRCPGWIFHPNQPSAAPLWLLAGMFTVLPALWICNIALRWNTYYERKMYDSIMLDGSWMLPPMTANLVVITVMVGWCAFCAVPLFLMLGQCTALSHYLNLNI
jgi:hypothetical protein